MRPLRTDKNKYVGIEIECFGPLTRQELINRLAQEESLTGIHQVGTDRTITPTEVDPIVTTNEPEEGALDITTSPHATRQLDLAEKVFRGGEWVVNRVITFRSRARRQAKLNEDQYWCNQDHDVETEVQPVAQHTYEIRLFTKQSDMTRNIKKVYKILNEVGCSVNDSCGLHVHLDMRHRNPLTSYHNLYKCQDMLFSLHSEDRENGEYCRRNDASNLIGHVSDDDTDKYYAINPFCYNRLKTIEVRLAGGTMDATQVVAWCDLLCTIVDDKLEMETTYRTLDSFTDDYDLTRDDSIEVLETMGEAAA